MIEDYTDNGIKFETGQRSTRALIAHTCGKLSQRRVNIY